MEPLLLYVRSLTPHIYAPSIDIVVFHMLPFPRLSFCPTITTVPLALFSQDVVPKSYTDLLDYRSCTESNFSSDYIV